MTTPFALNPKQVEQFELIKSPATHILGLGGSRSGKTFGFGLACVKRAITVEGARIGVFRSTMKAANETLFQLTFPDVMRKAYPGLLSKIEINKSEYTFKFENGSVILFGGLDDDNRMEQILGQEFNTIYVNEISQIHSYKPMGMLSTRLSQQLVRLDGKPSSPKMFYDCNPPSNKHWAYKLFVEKIHPETGKPLKRPEQYVSLQMNPVDNAHNLQADYLDGLDDSLSDRDKRRFIAGEWTIDVDGALFKVEWIDDARVHSLDGIELVRIIVAVDPATMNSPGSDETGIIVAGIDAAGHAYILADRSVKGTPETWAKAVAQAYEEFECDLVIYEQNQGGLMVETTLRSSGVPLPMKAVHASRGKVIRAEPVSLLYEKGQVSHVGPFKELEDQMANFTLTFNRAKQGSPDRLDALVWALTELKLEKQRKPSSTAVSTAKGMWG